jgi:hypothetical protein
MSVDKQKLIDKINHAFSGVRLEDGTSLNMTEYNDSGGYVTEFMDKAKHDEREDWTSIPDETLEQFTVTFSFTDLKGFRFYIAAYMIWTLRNHHISNSIIADNTIYAIDPSHYLFESMPFRGWFTHDQISAMVEFLEYAIENDGSLDGKVARQNLAKIRKSKTT